MAWGSYMLALAVMLLSDNQQALHWWLVITFSNIFSIFMLMSLVCIPSFSRGPRDLWNLVYTPPHAQLSLV